MRKRSVASSKLLSRYVFFIDRSLGGKVVPDSLRDAGAVVEIHDDHFPSDTPDDRWLQVAGSTDWIVLTKDKAIRRNELERRTLLESGVRAFVLVARRNLLGEEIGAAFVTALPVKVPWWNGTSLRLSA